MQRRNDDMHEPGLGVLIVNEDSDGDMILTIVGKDQMTDKLSSISVEFCTGCGGGGRSPNVYAAIKKLAQAIKLDNAKSPSHAA